MTEVSLGRVAGPFKNVPFNYYMQSPIGLVPKDGGRKTRLIFHLSYPKNSQKSVNSGTPLAKRTVKYKDFNDAIQLCLQYLQKGKCVCSKTDLVSAFRILCIKSEDWPLLVMKAEHPVTNEIYYFFDKCLPFGHSISCALFQRVSDAIEHIFSVKSGHHAVNYLDDFLFVDESNHSCNLQMQKFLGICLDINFPVSEEKTQWAAETITFLGLLIDTLHKLVSIPVEKITKARDLIDYCLNRKSRKITLLELQRIAGYLNFLCKAVIPGRAFTRRLYYATKGLTKPFHHTNLSSELKKDLRLWLEFLKHPAVYCRPFLDFDCAIRADQINLYTDASRDFCLVRAPRI